MKIEKSDQVDQTRQAMRGGDGCAVLHHILTKDTSARQLPPFLTHYA